MRNSFFTQDALRDNALFFIGLFLYLFIGSAYLEYLGKEEMHLYFNQFHSPLWDEFFKGYTQWGIPIMIVVVLFLIVRYSTYKTLFYMVSAFGLFTLISLFVKRTYFIDVHRPQYYFELKNISLHLVEGVSRQITYTYPSGHSGNAFLLMLFCSMFSSHKYLQLLCFLSALLIALSRIYLSKHFYLDTAGGALLGVFCNLLFFYIFQRYDSPWMNKKILSA